MANSCSCQHFEVSRNVQTLRQNDFLHFQQHFSAPWAPTRLRIVLSRSLLYPPNTSIMMLNCFTWYPGNCLFNFSRSWAYFSVFSQLFVSLLFSQGQLISSKVTDFAVLSTILASTLFALTVTWSAYTGTSQKACAWSFWYTGFSLLGEYHGGTLSTRSWLCSKNTAEINKFSKLQFSYFVLFNPRTTELFTVTNLPKGWGLIWTPPPPPPPIDQFQMVAHKGSSFGTQAALIYLITFHNHNEVLIKNCCYEYSLK